MYYYFKTKHNFLQINFKKESKISNLSCYLLITFYNIYNPNNLPSNLSIWDTNNTDSRDGQQVEGSRSNDGAGAQLLGLEPVSNHTNNS